MPLYYASAVYQTRLVEPCFLLWLNLAGFKCPWRKQTTLICRRIVRLPRYSNCRTQVRPSEREKIWCRGHVTSVTRCRKMTVDTPSYWPIRNLCTVSSHRKVVKIGLNMLEKLLENWNTFKGHLIVVMLSLVCKVIIVLQKVNTVLDLFLNTSLTVLQPICLSCWSSALLSEGMLGNKKELQNKIMLFIIN